MCSQSVAKWCLMILNILFLLLGAACLGIGIFALVNTNDDYYTYLTSFSADLSSLDTPSLLRSAAIVLTVTGGVIFVIAVLGFCGACKQMKACLYVYAFLVIIILGAEVAAVVVAVFFQSRLDTYATNWLTLVLTTHYVGPYTTSNVYSLAYDVMMVKLQCCGASDGNDFDTISGWNTTYITGGTTYTASIPLTCCEYTDISKFPTDIPAFIGSMKDSSCPYTELSSYNSTGCYSAIKTTVLSYSAYVIGIGAAIAVVELLAIIFAFVLACKDSSDTSKMV